MKIKLIKKKVVLFIMVCSLLYSCTEEENLMPDSSTELQSINNSIEEKLLARVILPEQITISFIKEEDGISYHAIGKTDLFKGLSILNELSISELFLTITNNDVAVPESLRIAIEDQKIKIKASERAIISYHPEPIIGKSLSEIFKTQKTTPPPSICIEPDNPYEMIQEFDSNGMYSRLYKGYYSIDGINSFYSSGKKGSDKCKKIGFDITNCNYDDDLRIATYKKNILGNYIWVTSIKIPSYYTVSWAKEYSSNKRRYMEIKANDPYTSGFVYGGLMYFKKYK